MKKVFNMFSILLFFYCMSYLLIRYQEISKLASSASFKMLFLPAYSFLVGSGVVLFSPLLNGERPISFRHFAYTVAFFVVIYIIDYAPAFYACHCISLTERMAGIKHPYMCLVSLIWIVFCCLSMENHASDIDSGVPGSK